MAAGIGLPLLRYPVPVDRTLYLLQQPAGQAGAMVRSIDGLAWQTKTLAAWPPSRGLGRALVMAITGDADQRGAAVELWCTRHLERWYRTFGFAPVRRRLMRRPVAPSPA